MKKLLLLLVTLAFVCHGQIAGFKTTLSQNGLDYLKGVGVTLLEQKIGTLTIPNLSGEAGTPIGKIDWDLSSLSLTNFAIASSTAGLIVNQGISLSLSGVTCHVGLDWHYREKSWPHISDHGTADVEVGVSSEVNIQITTTNGRPVLHVSQDSVKVGELKIHLHGGASWLYQIFVDIFSPQIKDAISKALTSAISQNIDNGLNKALSTLPIQEPIDDHNVEINFELIGNPLFTSSYMAVPELGEFYVASNPQECPDAICPRSTTPDIITTEMLQMIITDFVANSAGFAFFKLGKLILRVQDKEIPSWSPLRLNTTSFKYVLPNLYSLYPNNLLELSIYSTQAPQATFNSQGATVDAIGNIDMLVVLSNGTLVPAFTLTGVVRSSGSAHLSGLTLSGNLTYLTGNFSLQSSQIGPVSVSLFDSLLNLLFSTGVVPAVNTILEKGFDLPAVKGLTFINPTLGFGNRFVYVSTNVQYIPPLEDEPPIVLAPHKISII